jgi:AmiR/NasT family two-component response regulator
VVDGQKSLDGDLKSPELAELVRLTLYADAQERRVSELQTTVSQLQAALDSRVAIERAVGMLAERLDLPLRDAFEVLRSAARSSRREVRALAEQMMQTRSETPAEVLAAVTRLKSS